MVRPVIFLACALASQALAAQTPKVISVVNSGSGDARFSPGVIVRVTGANLAISTLPTVTVGGIKADYVYNVDGDDGFAEHLDVQLPPSLPSGPTSLVVSTEAGSSQPFAIAVEPYSPVFVYPAFLRSPDGNSVPIVTINNCFVQSTATAGDTLTVTVGGLGTDPAVLPGMMVGALAADVLSSTPVAGRPGTTLVTFRVPPGNGVFAVLLTLAKTTSQALLLAVGNVKGYSTLGLTKAAPNALVTTQSCGPNLAEPGARFVGDAKNPPLTLGGVTVTVADAAGVERQAAILQIDCCSISYIVPAGTADGLATVTASNIWGSITGYLNVRRVSPVLPLVIGAQNGQPYVSGYVVRVRNGVAIIESAAALLNAGIYGMRVDMGPDTDEVFLVLLGTGLRNGTSLQNAKALIGGVEAPIEYVGPQSEVAGIDQVNIRLPRSLAHTGLATLQIAVDGVPNDFFYLEFK